MQTTAPTTTPPAINKLGVYTFRGREIGEAEMMRLAENIGFTQQRCGYAATDKTAALRALVAFGEDIRWKTYRDASQPPNCKP